MTDQHITTRELTDDEIEDHLLAALRERHGEVTDADLVVASGLPPHQVTAGLRRLVVEYVSRLAVTSDGQVRYCFDPRLVRRSARPLAWMKAVGRGAWAVFALAFKILTGLVLLVYVGVFALLLLLVLNVDFISFDGQLLRSLRQPHRLKRAWDWLSGVSLWTVNRCRKVFAFIFGPPQARPDEFKDERELLAFTRAQRGIITPAEILAQTGWPSQIADQESTRLVARYAGEVEIDDGQVLFTFRDLMATADPGTEAASPPPCWERLEEPMDPTGNSTGTDLVVAGINAYVLVSALILVPLIFAPQIGFSLESPRVRWALIYIPALYALGAFAIHAARRALVGTPENRRRLQRNLRRLLLREAFRDRDVNYAALAAELATFPVPATAEAAASMTQAMAIELGASVEPGEDGRIHFAWKQFKESLAAARARRARLPTPAASEVIYSTDDPIR
jgi:hypothetical protein